MEKVLLFVLLILSIAVVSGCTSHNVVQKPNFSFKEEYDNIISSERGYNITNLSSLNSFKMYLSNFTSKLENESNENVSAIKKFIEFRINLLNAQKSLLLAEKEEDNCSDCNCTFKEFAYTNHTINNLTLTLKSLREFKANFSKQAEETNINQTTITNLKSAMEEMNQTLIRLKLKSSETCK